VAGQVQGVGFRPFAYRLARSLHLTGWVANTPTGATVEVQGPPADLESFARRLSAERPPLAEIGACRAEALAPIGGEEAFAIRPSAAGELADAQVTVDTATCADCLRELRDPADPRWRYPFINCTNCGPRYSIIKRIPYDRPNTTMADFAMCRLCASQYGDPSDRRFHAQPIACPACGPSCWLTDTRGRQVVCDDPIIAAGEILRRGRIVAVKGLGGFHLACRADDDHVVRRLRRRKGHDAKPFALMVRDLAQARGLCRIDPPAEGLLTGPQRPIVLLPRCDGAPVAESVAPHLNTLGIMLPYTPLHHLLLAEDLPALVMTSGNVSDEPLTKDNDDAVGHLGRIADALLLHNRRIERSLDDSVVQADPSGPPAVARRARGYAPRPIVLEDAPAGQAPAPAVLAVGAELKSTVCCLRAGRAVVSEHIGDLKDGRVYRHFMGVINDLEALFEIAPTVLAADMHPQYLSTEYALRRAAGDLAGRGEATLIRVQHHHAHVVSCLADNRHAGPAIGLACDGAGYGTDGTIWGCEVLLASPVAFTRLGHLRYFGCPGGDAAAVQTARPAVALLAQTFGADAPSVAAAIAGRGLIAPDRLETLLEQIAAGVNCPPTSSLGRLFDAVAALCGVADANRYEAEAPMRLEAAARDDPADYPFALTDAEPFDIDVRPMIAAIAGDLARGVPAGVVSGRFHNTVAAFLAAAAGRAREATGLETVALSGGCFANRLLAARLADLLRGEGFEVLTHRDIPCNDGGVALGQAVIAARRAQDAGPARADRNERTTHRVSGHSRKD